MGWPLAGVAVVRAGRGRRSGSRVAAVPDAYVPMCGASAAAVQEQRITGRPGGAATQSKVMKAQPLTTRDAVRAARFRVNAGDFGDQLQMFEFFGGIHGNYRQNHFSREEQRRRF